jgi:hypothetical protein
MKNLFEPKIKIDPREKSSANIEVWAKALFDARMISSVEYNEIIQKNSSLGKQKQLEERKFPQLKTYGFFNSIQDIRDKIKPKEGDKFYIRCINKKTKEFKRVLNSSLDEICEFAENLNGESKDWEIEVREYVDTNVAGTIIVFPSGKTTIESWHGGHYLNVTDCPKYHGEFDPEQFDKSFKWKAPKGAEDLRDIQEYAIKALRYIFPHLKPREGEPLYVEYGIKPNGEIYFIEANDSKILTS